MLLDLIRRCFMMISTYCLGRTSIRRGGRLNLYMATWILSVLKIAKQSAGRCRASMAGNFGTFPLFIPMTEATAARFVLRAAHSFGGAAWRAVWRVFLPISCFGGGGS